MPERTPMLVLHTLRLVGVAAPSAVAERTGADEVVVAAVLDELRAEHFVKMRTGALEGWLLTPAGRRRGEQLLAEELEGHGARPALLEAYEGFLALNAPVLRVCSDWQVRTVGGDLVVNDHRDPDWDAGVLGRLAELHALAEEVLVAAEEALDRFATYRPRLSNALARARGGGVEWVTKPRIDSYHSVWFELHEDLLATLGRRRVDERENVAAADGGAERDEDDT